MAARGRKRRDIAVIGMSCRFPGGATTPAAFWDLLISGRNAITDLPADRWQKQLYWHPDPAEPGKTYSVRAGTLGDVSGFDAAFFGISPREAEQMDPQQRILLEMTFEALENAGLPPDVIGGNDCAVYVGISSNDYAEMRQRDPAFGNAYSGLGSTMSIAANRISYVFDLKGPSMAVDTACSSALVALDAAVRAMRDGRSSMAIVGSCHLLLSPYPYIGFAKASMLSPLGQCRAFDKDAKGYVRAEGGGIVVLKFLDDAERDGDPIQAVIRGTGVNSDGRTHGIALPSGEAQEALLRQVYGEFGVRPQDVVYFEAHGTGTAVGDPAEVGAVGRALGQARKKPLPIGSVKSNIGHLEPAAGMAGMLKAILALRNRTIPASLNCDEPNPDIDFAGLNMQVARQQMPFPKTSRPAAVGVSSFGFGGANAHVILEEYRDSRVSTGRNAAMPIYLSARSADALKQMAVHIADDLAARPASEEYDAAYTLALRRGQHDHRLVCRAEDPAAIVAALRGFGDPETVAKDAKPAAQLTESATLPGKHKLAFVYAGNGAQWQGMGVLLLAEDAAFRAEVERIDALIRAEAGWSLIEELKRPAADSKLDDTRYAQPMLFALQAGLTASLAARGLRAEGVVGHSVGEVAAAYASGALDLPQAVSLILHRSNAQELARGKGRMAAAEIDPGRAEAEIASHRGKVELAAINSPNSVTLSGEGEALIEIGKRLKRDDLTFRLLDLQYPFHSRILDPIQPFLAARLAGLAPVEAKIPFYSATTGGPLSGVKLDADYWWDNVRKPVQFSPAVAEMAQDGYTIFLEIGPHPIMQAYIRATLRGIEADGQPLGLVTRERAGQARVTAIVDQAWCLGAHLDFQTLFPERGRVVDLPTYPWQHESFWLHSTSEASAAATYTFTHPFLGIRQLTKATVWELQIDNRMWPFLQDHIVGGSNVFPGAAFIDMALAAAVDCFGDVPLDLEDFEVRRPLVLDNASKMVRTYFDPEDGAVTIESRSRMTDDNWTQHTVGRIVPAPENCQPAVASPPVLGGYTVTPEQHYDLSKLINIPFGPAFQPVTSARVDGDRAIGELSLPEAASDRADEFLLHPVLLDGTFQVLLDLATEYIWQGGRAVAYLPYRFDRLRYYGRGGKIARSLTEFRQAGMRSLVVDITMFDADGNTLVEIRRMRFQRVDLNRIKEPVQLIDSALTPLPLLVPARHPARLDPSKLLSALASPVDDKELRAILADVAGRFAAEGLAAFAATGRSAPARPVLFAAAVALAGAVSKPGTAEVAWRDALHRRPDALAELTMIARGGGALPALLNDSEAIAPNLSLAMHDHFRGASPTLEPARNALVTALTAGLASLPPHHRPRVLMAGAEFDDFAETVLAVLPKSGFDFTFAVTDPSTVSLAEGALANRSGTRALAMDALVAEDGIFDLVVALGLFLDETEPDAKLAILARHVAPGGALVLSEPKPAAWLDLAFGGETAWWSGDRSRLVAEGGWAEMAETLGLVESVQSDLGTAQILTGLAPAESATAMATLPAAEDDRPWLILAAATGTESELADRVIDLLQQAGHHALRLAPAGVAFESQIGVAVDEPAGWSILLGELASMETPPAGIVHLLGFDARDDDAGQALAAQDARCWPIVSLVQAVRQAKAKAAPQLILVTRQAAIVPPVLADGELPGTAPIQAPLWGLGRVLQNECPDLACRIVDLHPEPGGDLGLAEALVAELLVAPEQSESEIILATDRRFGTRSRQAALPVPVDANAKTELAFTAGSLDNLSWIATERRAPAAGEVEIEMRAAGLNFRDVMFAMGLLPDEAVERGFAGATLGMEGSGVIARVGDGVTDLKPGDAVMCSAPASFSSHVTVSAGGVMPKPDGIGFYEAATIPSVFFTVCYALEHLARLQPGERILIHGAAGGVGLAAIQYARHIGAEIFATAGSDEKRMIVELAGVAADHVLDSRSLSFADRIFEMTGGVGIDVVLNSLAGEAIPKNLSILRPFGRLLELGKRDFYANSRMGLRPLRNNITFFGIDADQLMVERRDLARQLFKHVTRLFAEGVFHPLPYRVFSSGDVVKAFRHMQQSRHVGKIILTPPAAPQPVAAPAPLQLDPTASYLVSGGLTGFGLSAARFLVSRGARNLILISRRGATTPEAEAAVAQFTSDSVSVIARALDVTDEAALRALMLEAAAAKHPVKGVIHAAAVFEDGILERLEKAQFDKVLAPKMAGGWALHRATLDQPLDLFVVFSSISTVLGNPGQANYVAANMFLESLIEHRRAAGLPGLAICWGPIEDAGYLTRNVDVQDSLISRLGVSPMPAEAAMLQMERLLVNNIGQAAVTAIDWRVLQRSLPAAATARLKGFVARGGGGEEEEAAFDIDALIGDLTPTEVLSLVSEMIGELVGQVLRMPPEKVDRHKSVFDLGMDSLMLLELRTMIEKRFGIELSQMAMNEGVSIQRISERVRDDLLGRRNPAQPDAIADAAMAGLAQHALNVSDADLASAMREVEAGTAPTRLLE